MIFLYVIFRSKSISLSAHLENERCIILPYKIRKTSNLSRNIPCEAELELVFLSAIIVQNFAVLTTILILIVFVVKFQVLIKCFIHVADIVHSELGLTGSKLVSDHGYSRMRNR